MLASDLQKPSTARADDGAALAVHADFGGASRRGQDVGLFRLQQCIGLGNLLCTWGDTVLYAEARGLPMLWPTWAQLSREALSSGRTYARPFESDGSYPSGAERSALLRAWRRGDAGVVSVGLKQPFNVDWTHGTTPARDHAVLSQALWVIVPGATRRRVDACTPAGPFVAVHVRRGDSLDAVHHGRDRAGRKVNQPVPIEWYVATLRQALARAGARRALVDLLRVSCAAGFIASGSTFSQWMAYLGQMPIWDHPDLPCCRAAHIDPAHLVQT